MNATDAQMQHFSDERLRRRAEQIRALIDALEDDTRSFDAIYARLNDGNAEPWADARTDGPPNLMTGNDLGAYNTYAVAILNHLKNAENANTVLRACVRPL
jgi:hypothetical protein